MVDQAGKGGIVIVGLIFAAVLLFKTADTPSPPALDDTENDMPAIDGQDYPIVVIAEQASEGMTESDMDASFLDRYIEWHRSTFRKKYQAYLGDAYDSDAEKFFTSLKSEGVYTYLPTGSGGSKKLLIVRTRSPNNEVQIAEINGLAHGNFVRILCVAKRMEVLITQGKCGRAVGERFGVLVRVPSN